MPAPLSQFDVIMERTSSIRPPFHLSYWRRIRFGLLFSIDLVVLVFCYWAAFLLRLDGVPTEYVRIFFVSLSISVACQIFGFAVSGLYRQVWRYANFSSAILICRSVVLGTLLGIAANFIFARDFMPPRSIPIIFGLLATVLITFTKFSWRAYSNLQISLRRNKKERCLIYGAGSGGDLLAKHIAANPNFPYHAIGYIDDDKNKVGRLLNGLRILGSGDDLLDLCELHGTKTVLLAMHSPPGKVMRAIVEKCRAAGVKPLVMPDIAKSLNDETYRPRAVDIKDLLRRSPKSIDHAKVHSFFANKCVLITGAGGSIGSEICRQVKDCEPSKIVLLDSSEFNLYTIERELRDNGNCNNLEIVAVLGSAACKTTVENLFSKHRPHYVLHAAAYKHVPLVEENPIEGVLNNIVGTRVVADAAIKHRVEKFLLISTDKAVRPTNVMGATKRCCEILIQSLHFGAPAKLTSFSAVRFGNVLGSSGSVVPRFLQQIDNGGPVTVTHPEVTRFFMLISEAVGLVLQSIASSTGGEIFVLNMGDPVKIVDMARDLIELSGKEAGKDIDIEFTGLRPGEKLFEELILEDSEQHSIHDDVFVAIPQKIDPSEDLIQVESIVELAETGKVSDCVSKLMDLANRQIVTKAEQKLQSWQQTPNLH